MIKIPRKNPACSGHIHTPLYGATGEIYYAALGSDLEHRASIEDSAELMAFARKFRMTTDPAMAALACFAAFKATAICERLAGRIDAAMLAESNANCVYNRAIKPENRW